MIADPARHARLLTMKLETLVREQGEVAGAITPGDFAPGAALMAGRSAWVLVDGPRGLGPALAWALRRRAGELHVLSEAGTGTLARRAPAFSLPVEVWFVDGRTLLPAIAEPLPGPTPLDAAHEAFVPLIEAAGADVVIEHGVLGGEVFGLEVCRVVDAPSGVRLEVGIGAHDREAFQLLHGDRPTVDALTEVVRVVAQHRRPGAPAHALNRIARERALRARLVAEPALVHAASVQIAAPPVPRPNLKDATPCVAIARNGARPVGLVCSAGVDLDVVPYAVDARAALGLDVCIVVPQRDAVAIQHDLAAALRQPIAVVPFGG